MDGTITILYKERNSLVARANKFFSAEFSPCFAKSDIALNQHGTNIDVYGAIRKDCFQVKSNLLTADILDVYV